MAKEALDGEISSGTTSFNGSSAPNGQSNIGQDAHDVLQRSQGRDHTVTHRHRLGLQNYPADSPPLKVRWFYAVDSPKWKPSFLDRKTEKSKSLPAPRKFVPFVAKDSQAIEHAFQDLCKDEIKWEQENQRQPIDKPLDEPVKVPVNEDYLFDVNINRRELGPAYWIGPVYEVRRGTWFFQEGSTIRPCEENLATQLEEGYLKMKPWRSAEDVKSNRTRTGTEQEDGNPTALFIPANEPGKYRLFGSYMNSIVTYQDSTTALITNDDFMSRVSTTVYQTLGGIPGTKLIRGFTETKKSTDTPDRKGLETKPSPALTAKTLDEQAPELSGNTQPRRELQQDTADSRPITTLERRVSTLAGTNESVDYEEQARKQEEREMENLRDADDEDREREIDHLVLVTHGIGQRLGLRLESVNFIHDVNVLRKTMKRVYKASPDLQALNSTSPDKQKNCRVQVLPVCWRHLLEFPYKNVGRNREELDLADADALEDDVYPALSDITLESVPAVRNLISDLAIDVLLYQSKHREQISAIVKQECNRIVELYTKRNPSFKGTVSLCGHSLGSAIMFDILCSGDMHKRDPCDLEKFPDTSTSSFNFECEEFFCLGSPVALFEMLKGKTIAGRADITTGGDDGVHMALKQPSTKRQSGNLGTGIVTKEDQVAVSIPKCGQLYNIFHPSDPVSYRMEPLISPAMSSLKPQPLPSVKRSIWTTSGQSLSLIGSRVGQSVGSLWTNFTSGVASSLLNRSLGISSEESPPQQPPNTNSRTQPRPLSLSNPGNSGDRSPTLIDPDIETLYEGFQKAKMRREKAANGESNTDSPELERGMRKLKLEEEKVRLLNSNGRVDYSIQEGAFDISLIASLASHLSYWSDEDVNHFMLSQMLCRKRATSKSH
ncbi:DDHD domain-containing protein [Aspergillus filifer]